MKVIALLSEDGAVDELGVGVIRNALSDKMFNGAYRFNVETIYKVSLTVSFHL